MNLEKSISNFAKWYAYELHKFTFGNRKTEPTLKEFTKNNPIDVLPHELLRLLDRLTYFNHITLSTIDQERIKIAEQGKQETTNELTEYYLNNY